MKAYIKQDCWCVYKIFCFDWNIKIHHEWYSHWILNSVLNTPETTKTSPGRQLGGRGVRDGHASFLNKFTKEIKSHKFCCVAIPPSGVLLRRCQSCLFLFLLKTEGKVMPAHISISREKTTQWTLPESTHVWPGHYQKVREHFEETAAFWWLPAGRAL